MDKLKSIKKIATTDKPYGLINGEIWMLPFDKQAEGAKWGQVIAELDDGYLTVFDKNMATSSITYIPKVKVQL